MTLLLVILIPFLGALIPPLVIRSGRNTCAAATGGVTLLALALLLSHAPAVFSGEVPKAAVEWVPSMGLSVSVFADGLGFFFAAMILVIGLLVIVYARFYLSREDPMGRFFAYLLLFQGAMVGVVLSDNVILLLVFWEMTSLTSFLLIGYWRKRADARQGARMALVVTGGGGLALIAGLLLVAQAAGSWQLSEILARGELVRASPLYLPALLLVLLGAFTKSAQFPFHFWLPHAMAAPTPVSAYLHSATMVKAGVFLLARLWPVLAGTEAWFLIVAPVGLATMLIGAAIALFRTDLKGLLAYSTVSHLGLMTMLLGLGTPMAAVAAVFHIINHATFKAALFMSAGIVDHETGTRDIRRLGGLMALMPITGTLALLAAASMAGIPLFNGFLSKEMMLEEAAHTAYLGLDFLFPVLATIAAVFSVAYSARFAIGTFLGPVRRDYPHHPHDPPIGMWLPVAILVVPVIAIGLLPELVAGPLVALTAAAVIGGPLPDYHLALWHGITPALLMSLVAFAGGAALVLAFRQADTLRARLPRLDAQTLFEIVTGTLVVWCRRGIGALHDGALTRYMGVTVATLVAVGGYGFWSATHAAGTRPMLPVTAPAVTVFAALVLASGGTLLFHGERLTALILTGVVGVVVALVFLQFSAPDLALTQISVDVVTTILMLLALNLLPKTTPVETSRAVRWRDGVVAGLAGLGAAGLAYAVMTRSGASISDFYLAQSKPGGGGTNVVNVILVDFRGYDTFAEIIVLGIAALAIYALLDPALKGAAVRRIAAMLPREESRDAHPLLLVVATRVLLPLSLAVGAYIFLRGHNLPGGGFVAGLVVAIALIMQYIASGYGWAAERMRVDSQSMIGAGVAIAGLTGLAAFVFGRPFLTSTFGYQHWPVVGTFELASAMAFDLGVFLTVVGVMVLSLAQLSRVAQRIDPVPETGEPMDVLLEGAPPGGPGREG
ncbi:monovalent cation/H+ antiporter subunit A [Aquabacter spiritensis]|uniref:Multisubunit potassium/proton antiporter PhaA subunit /multisubunit potassium/proton antiporter PhaB subunit n=1 Tax=Aquabacter spiritensis TaxID=933073 RepID=A0A4R3LWU7_9HYPH|nr:monovalent cation/H+ antiporter subunit A [Aquabacter spiritensis]TCT05072.1 multisubunit potassium/proton antiporter PhaA subunit /multisubunit potassium/proton antiporter PhaB subunit [Aquabacter spiritensis]